MKGLSIEEKAKAYDEAIDKVAHFIKKHIGFGCMIHPNSSEAKELFNIFPELKESEDERIRNWLIETIKRVPNDSIEWETIDKSSVLAWLEKQGEQKSADIEEPDFFSDFRNSDVEVDSNEDGLIAETLRYNKEKQGEHKPNPCDGCINRKGCINCENGELRETEHKPADKVEPKFRVEKDKWYVCTSQYCNCIEGRNYKASLDGRIIDDYGTEYDMHDDAYKYFRLWTIQDAKEGDVLAWDDSKCIVLFKNIYDEDSFNSHGFVGHCTGAFELRLSYHDIKGAHPATKEQRDLLFQKMKEAGYEWDEENKELKKIEHKPNNWLKSLRPQNRCAYNPYKVVVESIAAMVEKYAPFDSNLQDFYNNVKVKCKDAKEYDSLFPQSQWEPSDEQMKALAEALSLAKNCGEEGAFDLRTLYEQLKELREE